MHSSEEISSGSLGKYTVLAEPSRSGISDSEYHRYLFLYLSVHSFGYGCVFVFWKGIVCWYGNTRSKVFLDCWSSSGLVAKSWCSLSEQLLAQMTTPAPCKWRNPSYRKDIKSRHSVFMSRLAWIVYQIFLILELPLLLWSSLFCPCFCVHRSSTWAMLLGCALQWGILYFHTFSKPLPCGTQTFS